jgi:hypothetical protein
MVSVEVDTGGTVTLAGRPLRLHPTAGTMLVVSVTVPVKVPTGVTVIVEVPLVPTSMVMDVGLAVMVKSLLTTVNVTVTEWLRLPLIPVTTALKLGGENVLPVQLRVAVPGGLTPLGDTVQLICGSLVTLSATGAPKPLTGLTVMVEVPGPGAGNVTLVGLAVMVKSTNWKLAVAVCTRLPSVAVMPTVNVWASVEVHISVAVAGDGGSVTLPGEIGLQVSPAGMLSVSVTVPLNPLIPVTVMVEVPEEPTEICWTEVAATLKSVTVKVIAVVVWDSGSGLVPVTVTV